MYRVVILDDEKEISNGFARFFPWNELGFVVAGQFRHGSEALEFIREHSVDLIISDVRMPGMSGIELARELSEMEPVRRPQLVFFSAYSEFSYAQQAIQYGAMQYILKSTPFEELVTVFREIKEKLDGMSAESHRTEETEHDQVLAVMKDYIRTHVKDASLEQMALNVYMSPAYASRYFKAKTGSNFQDYLIQCRMERAAELLKSLRYRIGDISELVGYSNPFNFTRTFKKYYGRTPKEYRQEQTGRVLMEEGKEL